MSRKRKASTPAVVVDLVATDEDAWLMTRELSLALTQAIRSKTETIWRETGTLPHLQEMASWTGPMPTHDLGYSESRRGWFDMCIESIYLPRLIDTLRTTQHGLKRLNDVDFASLYSDTAQAQQCKEELFQMAKVTPGEFWPVTPRSAFRLMAAAEYLQGEIDNDDFIAQYSHALRGPARDAWRTQGPVGLQGGLDPMRERSWYFGLRDCFTKIAQRIAAGNKPQPKTHAELWACCLLFEADDYLMDTMGDDEGLCAIFDALPEHECDADLEITRMALLGPIVGSPATALPPKRQKKSSRASASTRPTADTRAARAAAMQERMANDTSPYALRGISLPSSYFEAIAEAEEKSDDDSDSELLTGGKSNRCVLNLREKPIREWFDPLPRDFFKAVSSSGGGSGGSSSAAASGSGGGAWDSQLSSSGWRKWPVATEGDYGLVYVAPEKKFGYYDDDDDGCVVYFGMPLLSPSGLYKVSQLRKPPFEGELVA